jgi:signal transduction histidine kinase
MRRHHGALVARSEPGQGAAFTIVLPTVNDVLQDAAASPLHA